MSREELVFVYNARSGAWNGLLDAAHKLLSPTTYACSLCALTYGVTSKRQRWASFVESLPHHVRFAYRDQLASHGITVFALPALLVKRDGTWVTLLDKTRIDGCASLDELIEAVREAVG